MLKTAVPMIAVVLTSCLPLFAQAPSQSPFYPLNVGDRWTYRVLDLKAPPGKSDGKKKVVVEVERQEKFTRKVEKDGKVVLEDGKPLMDTRVGFILKSTSGGKTTRDHVIVMDDGIHRIHAADTPITPPLNFFKHPLKPGETWECNSTSGNITIKGVFSWRSEPVAVPFGKMNTLVVSFTNNLANEKRVEIDYWFAEKIGMVKQRVREKNREIALELEQYEPAK